MKLLAALRRYPDESGLGFLLRVAEANGYENHSWIIETAGIGSRPPADRSIAIERLAGLLEMPVQGLVGTLYFTTSTTLGPGYRDFFGHRIGRPFVNRAKPRVCPHCLEERGYLSAMWDLAPVAICLRHGCWLIDTCRRCRRRLSWSRSSVGKCRCGARLVHNGTREVGEPSVSTALIHRAAGERFGDAGGVDWPRGVFEPSSLHQVLELVMDAGVASRAGGFRRQYPCSPNVDQMSVLITEADRALQTLWRW